MKNIDLSIIIVNYKTPSLTLRCIESIYATTKCNFEIIVVDNASNDNSKEIICNQFNNITWIQNKTNEGFGRANNEGVSNSKGEYILLLNSDMIVCENTIDFCLQSLNDKTDTAIFACMLKNADNSLQRNLHYDIVDLNVSLNNNIVWTKLFGQIHTSADNIKAIGGAFMLMRKKTFEDFNGFDPDFFMYFEEIDLCRRMMSSGKYHFDYTDKVYAIHKHEGSSTGKLWNRRQRGISESLLVYKIYGYGGFALYHFLQFNTVIMNLVVSFFIKKYRETSKLHFNAYMKNIPMNIVLPLLYSRKPGTGKRLLKIQ